MQGTSTAAASGKFKKKTQRHVACSTSHPPITGPIAVITALAPLHVPIARPLLSGGNAAVRIARLPGISSAAPSPCTERAAISARTSGANPQLADKIVSTVAELGPSTAGQIEAHLAAGPRGPRGTWWGSRSDTKWVAEALFASGVLSTATRVGFARHYDLVERVLPAGVLAREVDDDEDARRDNAARIAGVAGMAQPQ